MPENTPRAEKSGVRWGRFWFTRGLAKASAPSYSWCQRCKTPWKFVRTHSTLYTYNEGCFPLCERCWGELTPEERLPFYRQLWNYWLATSSSTNLTEEKWKQIETAVLAGL